MAKHEDTQLTSTSESALGVFGNTGVIEHVCVVHALKPDRSNGVTAIDKRPVTGPVKVSKIGLFADLQADRIHHGGFDQAIYAYSSEEAARWSTELGHEIPAGFFGENLRVKGITTSDAIVGERWRIGKHVEVEVTLPRVPCSTFARHMDDSEWVSRFTERGDIGCYLKVIRVGKISAGDEIRVISRPTHTVSIRQVFTGPTPEQASALLAEEQLSGSLLPEKITRKLGQLGFLYA
ncbi:MOSC domain-containing protein [Arthrobacter sp. MYb227]|uniref:MOSC domain-containing protein n=1 Tax=Arthrobacter sp. MYb227 TaxID=1848601 RepID=UPI000CFC9CE9|nr:MOSC domain-containing protein [Arthrobacter sp. MYb227]PQZ96167.1 MOSC domain-containing protein [Arthrobacter sp. MYb227]